MCNLNLNTLSLVILIDASVRALGVDTSSLGELFIVDSAVDILLEYRFGLDMLELSLEVLQASGVAAAVGTAASVGQVEAFVLDFLAIDTPMV
jgi:hypothetical protein